MPASLINLQINHVDLKFMSQYRVKYPSEASADIFFLFAQQPPVGHGLLFHEDSR